jgi:hypothetical protein
MTIANQLSVTKFPFVILDANGQKIYEENSDGTWIKIVYSPEGWQTNYETSTGYWYTLKYNDRGMRIRYDDSSGYWSKCGYDADGNEIWYVNSNGEWNSCEYDAAGSIIYRETHEGVKFDERNRKAVELTMDEIAEKLGIDVKDLKIKK